LALTGAIFARRNGNWQTTVPGVFPLGLLSVGMTPLLPTNHTNDTNGEESMAAGSGDWLGHDGLVSHMKLRPASAFDDFCPLIGLVIHQVIISISPWPRFDGNPGRMPASRILVD